VVRHKLFLAFTAAEILILLMLLVYSRASVISEEQTNIPLKRQLVKMLQLTDFSLWTEARYTRHPSQADFFTPFQDFPSSLEHFPAGSIIGPESIISRTYGNPGAGGQER
jgi:hypothetical protein